MDTLSPLALFAFQALVAAAMFFSINWLGKHSPMFGYESVTMFTEREDAVAFNFLFRVITPVVMLLVVAVVCHVTNLSGLTTNLHFALLWYLAFRVAFNLARGRAALLPWKRLILQWVFTIALAFVAYEQLISKPQNLLPDPATIANEVWLAIAGYLYVLAGHMFSGDTGQEARGARYVKTRRAKLEERFRKELSELAHPRMRLLCLAVMIVEDFNRPAMMRAVERGLFRVGRARTLGIMQVASDSLISDADSVRAGSKILERAYSEAVAQDDWRLPDNNWAGPMRQIREESQLVHATLVRYNPSGDYAREVEAVYDQLVAAEPSAADASLHPDRRGA
jgi:hypothetical protein